MAELKTKPTGDSRSCLYIKSLDDIHVPVLEQLIRHSVTYLKKNSV